MGRRVERVVNDLRARIDEHGWALLRAAEVGAGDLAREASVAPWIVAERLFGERPEMVERQPIRAVPGGRSFASSDVFTPLHTDSQPYAGAPPSAQVMICVRPASRGGETILADGFAIAERVIASDAQLARRLFEEARRIAFYFGDVDGPTIARRRGRVVFTHAPIVAKNDPLAARVQALVDAAPLIEVRPDAGDVLVVDNHRMLHGRRAFADPPGAPAREFVRLLVWLCAAWRSPSDPTHAGDVVASRAIDAVASRAIERAAPAAIDDETAAHRLAVVMELLRGAPPGVLSARERIAEAELYRWRDAALAAAARALTLRSS